MNNWKYDEMTQVNDIFSKRKLKGFTRIIKFYNRSPTFIKQPIYLMMVQIFEVSVLNTDTKVMAELLRDSSVVEGDDIDCLTPSCENVVNYLWKVEAVQRC